MRSGWLLVVAVVATACSGGPQRETRLANAAPAEPAAGVALTDQDALVHAVLARYLAFGVLPDHDLLPKQGPIYVLDELGDPIGSRISASALPEAIRPFELRTMAQLRAEAEAKNHEVAFIRFHWISVAGADATVNVGGDIVLPRQSHAIKTCCCSASYRYAKRMGKWGPTGDDIVVGCG